jgi:hypothetical protein
MDRLRVRGDGGLPDVLDHVAAEIDDSRQLLRLADDWDDAGSSGYAEPTWERATRFLVEAVTRLWRDHGIAVDGVDLFPGSRGNIDVEMRTAGRRLLVSVPADAAISARYLGQAQTGGTIKGTFDLDRPDDRLLGWLAG